MYQSTGELLCLQSMSLVVRSHSGSTPRAAAKIEIRVLEQIRDMQLDGQE